MRELGLCKKVTIVDFTYFQAEMPWVLTKCAKGTGQNSGIFTWKCHSLMPATNQRINLIFDQMDWPIVL